MSADPDSDPRSRIVAHHDVELDRLDDQRVLDGMRIATLEGLIAELLARIEQLERATDVDRALLPGRRILGAVEPSYKPRQPIAFRDPDDAPDDLAALDDPTLRMREPVARWDDPGARWG